MTNAETNKEHKEIITNKILNDIKKFKIKPEEIIINYKCIKLLFKNNKSLKICYNQNIEEFKIVTSNNTSVSNIFTKSIRHDTDVDYHLISETVDNLVSYLKEYRIMYKDKDYKRNIYIKNCVLKNVPKKLRANIAVVLSHTKYKDWFLRIDLITDIKDVYSIIYQQQKITKSNKDKYESQFISCLPNGIYTSYSDLIEMDNNSKDMIFTFLRTVTDKDFIEKINNYLNNTIKISRG